ncbi:MAG: DUF2950 domain-containing protein [Planctomycetota bacterium]|nr:DUF2950 domain-containing protein [Planctomycetota bacterium]
MTSPAQVEAKRSIGSRAFTLIELMIVVAIIAIIAAIAIPNLMRSRMSANETAAIAACKEYANAQEIYHRTDWDSDGVLEYSSSMRGGNSLYELTSGSGDLVLIDIAFARAEGNPTTATSPKSGYCFSILTGQGSNAPGGSKTYIENSNMIVGYGLSAVPYQYDQTGRNTFQINSSGTVYQQDRGNSNTTHVTAYDPDTTWVVSE